ncbi:MAG: hypothetical protein ABII12_10910 [Planctomycetota bacterium]
MVDTHVTPKAIDRHDPYAGPGAYRLKPGEWQERFRIETTRSLSDGVPVLTDPALIAESRERARKHACHKKVL